MSTRRTLRDLADLTERLHTMTTDVWQALPEAERSWALGAARRHLRSACEALDIAARQVPDDFVIVSGPERANIPTVPGTHHTGRAASPSGQRGNHFTNRRYQSGGGLHPTPRAPD